MKGKLDVTNSYAIPFDEDPNEPGVWFIDHMYHETMFKMYKKVASSKADQRQGEHLGLVHYRH